MSWETLAPLAAPSAAPMISAHIRKLKSGVVKLNLFLSMFIVDEMKSGKVEVQAGTGENEGKLRLKFGEGGAFTIKTMMRFARLEVPVPAGAPERSTCAAPCTILSKNAETGEIILQLPLDVWAPRTTASPAAPAPAPARAAEAPPPASGSPSPANPLVAADYLRTKGHKVEALAGNRLQVDGETLTKGQVLKMVNDHRAAADLEPLPHSAVV